MNQERVIAASHSDAQSGAEEAAQNEARAAADADPIVEPDAHAAASPFATAPPDTSASVSEPMSSQPNRPGTIRLGPQQYDSASDPASDLASGESLAVDNTMQFGGVVLPAGAEAELAGESFEASSLPFLEDTMGRRFVLRPGVNTVGRDHTDIKIADRSVSRYHGMVVYDEERDLYSVEDSGSMNGSRVNGERLLSHRPRAIHPGDQITFGDIILRFVDAAHAGSSPHRAQERVATSEELAEAAREIETAPTPLLEHFLWLKLLRGDAPEEILVGQGVTTVGRLPDNMICLADDRYVSGHHAKIEAHGEVFLLLDVGSTNGTYLNGLRLTTNTAVAMNDSDEVLIGGLLFQVNKPNLDAALPENDAFADYNPADNAIAMSAPDQAE